MQNKKVNKDVLKEKVQNEKIKIMKFYDAYYNRLNSPSSFENTKELALSDNEHF